MVDRGLDEPVYVQIAGLIREQIRSGALPPRRAVPSITMLVNNYGIARATATKALAILAEEGLIHRVPGKGWFVTPR